ncbi:uncharacterized protein BHQ10_000821 [Talaromyces amestolkiae]|uniref:Xylanolytic transcriptional activator regulatory domain-containing protein n=1 Tax=Talaromyces amestolkiae TaxID=1196081 RepID=A0A364KMN1_TALAM|nr:uncharacterized protein BHQ10_000821 [Talaromyces amestolkiae]RAO64809.1 hypothetical protein BHQ10_000821 [Talaromyces amestolkiae]
MDPSADPSQLNPQSNSDNLAMSSRTTSRSQETQSTPEKTDAVAIPAQQANQGYLAMAKVAIPRSRAGASLRHMEELSQKANDYESLLKDLRSTVNEAVGDRIAATLNKYAIDGEQNTTDHPSSSSRTPLDDVDLEPSSPSSIGSLEAIDRVEEDLNRGENVRATGFIGKNSEISWMQRVQRESVQRARGEPGMYEGEPQTRQYEDFAINSVSYHLDDLDINVSGPIDKYKMPSREQADRLFEDYLTTVHPFYPIISRPLFSSQFKYFFENSARPGDRWLAILNMIFAIAAKHSHLVQASWKSNDTQDHLIYFTRARYLSMTDDDLFSHPDLQQVQVEGLMAFYLLSTDQINRAWRISSLAVRSAIALGINMKSSSESTANTSKESRYRVWWSLYSFEHLLGVMTGRATCILDGVCTTPMPLPFEEERFNEPDVQEIMSNSSLREEKIQNAVASSLIRLMPQNPVGGQNVDRREKTDRFAWIRSIPFNSGLLFLLYMDLTVITQEIVNKVYTSDAVRVPWSHIENRIGDLKSRIDLWFNQLPEAFKFTQKESSSPEQVRAKLGLAFQYYSARITLGRPCLCRRDATSNKSTSFSHKMALVSLEAAARMLDLIPDAPDPFQLYQLAPWWSILHFLMQATTVLLLELSFANVHAPDEEKNTFLSAKKAIRWLYAMSEHSTASLRAWQLCDSCMRRIAVGMNYDVSDLPPLPSDAILEQQKQYQARDPLQTQPAVTSGPSRNTPQHSEAFDWSTGMESLATPSTEAARRRELLSDLELEQNAALTAAESVTYPLSFSPFMMNPGVSGSSISDSHFPYDPLSGEFMGSFFPPDADQHEWDN